MADIATGPLGGVSDYGSPRVVNGRLFFSATSVETGSELWVADAFGAQVVKDIRTGPEGSYPNILAVDGDQLYFAASDDEHGRELWVTDGTSEGTVLVHDAAVGEASSYPNHAVSVGGALFFTSLDSIYVQRDGVTSRIAVPQYPRQLTASGDVVYFQAGDYSLLRRELWRTDGTVEGTKRLADGGLASDLMVVNGVLFYVRQEAVLQNGELESKTGHLCRTDGTDEGTFELTSTSIGGDIPF